MEKAKKKRKGKKRSGKRAPQKKVIQALTQLSALLKFNDMSVSEGFESFDRLEEQRFTQADFNATVSELQLPISGTALVSTFEFMDSNKDGYVDMREWEAAIGKADSSEVTRMLKERGVNVEQPNNSPAPASATGVESSQTAATTTRSTARRIA